MASCAYFGERGFRTVAGLPVPLCSARWARGGTGHWGGSRSAVVWPHGLTCRCMAPTKAGVLVCVCVQRH